MFLQRGSLQILVGQGFSLCAEVGRCGVSTASKLLGKNGLKERAEDELSTTVFQNRLSVGARQWHAQDGDRGRYPN